MARNRLTPETFLAAAEMIAAQLRIKEADRWSPHICRLKFHSFTSEFPEVNETQFLWAAEQWIQGLTPGQFTRYPTWKELMAPLYRTENGLANRSWGFKAELPPFVLPTAMQLAALPTSRRSLAAAPDPVNAAAYVPFEADGRDLPLLPPGAANDTPLTPERWADYLRWIHTEEADAADEPRGTAANPGTGTDHREVVSSAVQQDRPRRGATQPGVSSRTPGV